MAPGQRGDRGRGAQGQKRQERKVRQKTPLREQQGRKQQMPGGGKCPPAQARPDADPEHAAQDREDQSGIGEKLFLNVEETGEYVQAGAQPPDHGPDLPGQQHFAFLPTQDVPVPRAEMYQQQGRQGHDQAAGHAVVQQAAGQGDQFTQGKEIHEGCRRQQLQRITQKTQQGALLPQAQPDQAQALQGPGTGGPAQIQGQGHGQSGEAQTQHQQRFAGQAPGRSVAAAQPPAQAYVPGGHAQRAEGRHVGIGPHQIILVAERQQGRPNSREACR